MADRLNKPKATEPVLAVAITPVSEEDAKRLPRALVEIGKRDPGLTVRVDSETGQVHVCGWSEEHVRLTLQTLRQTVAFRAAPARVLYRESIRAEVAEEATFSRSAGERSQYARCVLRLRPLRHSEGFRFVDWASKTAIPSQMAEAVKAGIIEAARVGPLAGYPLTDIQATLVDGSFKEGASTELAFKIAAAMAFRAGCKRADPTMLEPVMSLRVEAYEQRFGDVIGDLNARRATIQDMGDVLGKVATRKFLEVLVPLNELFGYENALKEFTLGDASVRMSLSHFSELPWDQFRARADPRGWDEPPAASAGRPVLPTRPRPGRSGADRRPLPPEAE